MNLKDKSQLERMIGRSWMYKTDTYCFNDQVELNGHVIISTDRKAISIKAENIGQFINDCLPADAPAKPVQGIDKNIFQELTDGLMESFREVHKAEAEVLKTTVTKAKTKIKIAGSVTSMAKVILEAQRMQSKS